LFDGTTGALLRTMRNPLDAFRTQFGSAVAGIGNRLLVTAPNYLTFNGDGGIAGIFYGGATRCGPCETSGPSGECVIAPHPVCHTLDGPGPSMIRLGSGIGGTVVWTAPRQALSGPGLDFFYDFANPTDAAAAHDYEFCLWDESGGPPALIFRAALPAGATCGSRPCWKQRFNVGGRGARTSYRNRDMVPEGIGSARLRSNVTTSQVHLSVRGHGPLLSGRPYGLPSFPLDTPLRVQLQVSEGVCWEMSYSAADVITSSSTKFSAKRQ
jgi:hypothetical protein